MPQILAHICEVAGPLRPGMYKAASQASVSQFYELNVGRHHLTQSQSFEHHIYGGRPVKHYVLLALAALLCSFSFAAPKDTS
jgi:hypothetical protein